MAEYITKEQAMLAVKNRLGTLDLFESRFKADIDAIPTEYVVDAAELREMLSDLESRFCGDGVETYTSGYRNGHRNGQIEILRYILKMPDDTTCEVVRTDGDSDG